MHRHSHVNCIVPPHILKNIATKGTESQKNLAIATLKTSERMRGQRQALADFSAAAFRVTTAGRERIVYDAKNGTSLPGTIARQENDPPHTDVSVNEAFDGSGLATTPTQLRGQVVPVDPSLQDEENSGQDLSIVQRLAAGKAVTSGRRRWQQRFDPLPERITDQRLRHDDFSQGHWEVATQIPCPLLIFSFASKALRIPCYTNLKISLGSVDNHLVQAGESG